MGWSKKERTKFYFKKEVLTEYMKEFGSLDHIDTSIEQKKFLAICRCAIAMIEAKEKGDLPKKWELELTDGGIEWDKDFYNEQMQNRKRLFEQAQEQNDWEHCYSVAKHYYQLFGTMDMPKNLEMNGVKLGEWIAKQKEFYAKNELSLHRINKLKDLGLKFNSRANDHISFDESVVAYYVRQVFPDAISSYEPECLRGKELDIYIPSLKTGIEFDGCHHRKSLSKDLEKNTLCAENGFKLIRIRAKGLPHMEPDDNCKIIKSKGTSNKQRYDEVVKVLKALGVKKMPNIDIKRDQADIFSIMIEDKTYFNQYLMAAKHFYQENGHLLVPKDYVDPTGVRLGKWIEDVRESKECLSERQINALEERGMVWEPEENAAPKSIKQRKASEYER